ncbi:hypothetical protein [Streptomyces sp. NPDC004685]
MTISQWLLGGEEREEPAGEGEAGVVCVTGDLVFSCIGGLCRGLEEEAGSPWLTGAGTGLVLCGDLPDDRGCRPAGLLGDLSKHRFFPCLA